MVLSTSLSCYFRVRQVTSTSPQGREISFPFIAPSMKLRGLLPPVFQLPLHHKLKVTSGLNAS